MSRSSTYYSTQTSTIYSDSQFVAQSQKSFLNTVRQLQRLMIAVSDADTIHQGLYIMIMHVGFSAAFNTIDYDKLL